MKLHKLNCPNCNGILDMKIADNTSAIFCPYCGQQFFVDDGKKEYTINENIHNRYTDDAKVLKEKNKDKKDKRDTFVGLFGIFLLLCMAVVPMLLFKLNEKVATSQGKISAGYYRDLIDKNYETVQAHFEAAGFTNIQLIDLDDSGLVVRKNGKVETISVGGNTSFEDTDFFEPDTKVVISYH